MPPLLINKQNWQNFASSIARGDPSEHNEAAIERLMDYIHPWVGHVKNVRPQFNTYNKILMIEFETQAQREYYDQAMDRYLADIAKIRAADMANSQFMELVAWLKFRQAAELIRAPWIAKHMYQAVMQGYAAGCAVNFKATTAKIVLELHNVFKVPRNMISLVWGGDSIYSGTASKEDIYDEEEVSRILTAVMQGEEVKLSILGKIKRQLQAQSAGLGDIPSYLRLGPQNFKDRQEEIDRYQRGDALYSIFNFKSGGIGLSLHHSDEMTSAKCRRKENGYVVVEDILLIPTRPRHAFVAPTYSAIELVQGLGRYPRISSLSDTTQTLVFYKGTIEGSVAAVTSQKLKCLTKVVRQRESWQDLILQGRDKAARNIDIPDEEMIDGREIFEVDLSDDEEEEEE